MLIVGLGNPGSQYRDTYHNVGFMVVDALLEKLGKKLKDRVCEAESVTFFSKGEKVVIAKPQTYMNLSGRSVSALLAYHKLKPSDVMVIYDDCDIPAGDIRIRKTGSGGTHNGMKNIVSVLGSVMVPRLRVGIGMPEGEIALVDYVLSKIKPTNQTLIEKAVDKASDCLAELIKTRDLDLVMNKYNGNL